MLAAYREKDLKTLWVREQKSGELLDAKKAFWVLGPDVDSREAFSARADAEAFSLAHGGGVVNYNSMMAALFSGMFDEIGNAALTTGPEIKDDITSYPECAYCGMDRKRYAHSRVLLKYRDGSETGLCSLHCAGLDLALHPEKMAARIMVGTYDRKKLIDAEKAVWVIGGSEHGVMSIRGKWAFEKKEDAEAFIHDHGGSLSGFRNIMTAVFEDMWEIIR
jgi:nitrous oxide reductase accessory protein NosL